MPDHRRWLPRIVASALAVLLLAIGALAADAAGTTGTVRLFTPSTRLVMTIHNSGPDEWVEFNPAIYLKARGTRFEVDVRRPDYAKPLQATVHVGGHSRRIPAYLLDGWNGFRRAFSVRWTTPTGVTLARTTVGWCPNDGQGSRLSPASATDTAFIYGCGTHPFTRSQRWGIDRGWARQILQDGNLVPQADLGTHAILRVVLRPELAKLFGIPGADRRLVFDVTVRHVTDPDCCLPGPQPVPAQRRFPGNAALSNGALRAGAPAAPGSQTAPPANALPDLVALPAYGMSIHHASGKDFLDFAATVYNRGPGPLVAEGFRRGTTRVMDAYQMFYRGTKLVGNARVGTMAYDARPSHQHWHFRDFAAYDLVNRDHQRVRVSGKEAFCLAPTDPIDLLVRGAVVNPGNGDLGTACGDLSSIWVREVLAAGWGDTYTQARAGQSFNITTLPNGTYWLRITANPAGRLHETTHRNDVSLRRVVLGGTPGARTVRVPAYGLVDSETGYGQGYPGGPGF